MEDGEDDDSDGSGEDEHDAAWLLEQNAWLMEELESKDGAWLAFPFACSFACGLRLIPCVLLSRLFTSRLLICFLCASCFVYCLLDSLCFACSPVLLRVRWLFAHLFACSCVCCLCVFSVCLFVYSLLVNCYSTKPAKPKSASRRLSLGLFVHVSCVCVCFVVGVVVDLTLVFLAPFR